MIVFGFQEYHKCRKCCVLLREVSEGGGQGERGVVATEERRGAESVCGLWADAYRRSNRVNKVNLPLAATSGGAQSGYKVAQRESSVMRAVH